ncbi:hypothetical protein QQX98_013057 [Neonectria punicea]|uniref:Uncharacterized protein n=1 Tax=Neonectria punicea TaxID=979145 RepID=A0ABR1GH70_9HYPO
MGNSQSGPTPGDATATAEPAKKPSLYKRMHDKKRGQPLSDEDILKYTGKSRAELKTWADGRPGVGKNQLAGNLAMGETSGLGGVAVGEGYGGWGPGSNPSDESRGLKFPPGKTEGEGKKV